MGTWYVKNLNEYIQVINCIYNEQKSSFLWFRGHEQTASYYYLEPNIYRNISLGKEQNNINDQSTYGTLWLKEDYRYQHFAARNYDKIQHMPESMIEWQEVMQHYFSKTRLMDWSESATVALTFALEAYINPVEDHEILYKRRNNLPVLWVLNPIKLNNIVYDCFENNSLLITQAMTGIKSVKEIINDITNHKELYFSLEHVGNVGVNGLVSLSGLEFLRRSYGESLRQAVETRSFNPFFYLLLRYYSDGLAVHVKDLAPLAIIHPYHSERIHEQRGAFTVFPYYRETGEKGRCSPFAMEFMPLCKSCLEKIEILDANETAKQLKEIGIRRSQLYPEMEVVTKDFEYLK